MSSIVSGKRKRNNRFVTVDGHTILKSNMYLLEEGEPSVWDRELNDESDSVLSAVEVMDTPVKKKSYYIKRNVVVDHEKAQLVSDKRHARSQHNLSIKSDIADRHICRQEFVRSNWEVLRPFVDEQQTCPLEGTPEPVRVRQRYPNLEAQPECIKNASMRDYQLEGVNWLINSYNDGINVILGGEYMYIYIYILY